MWWWLYAAAALSMYTTLGLPYIGEEAVYTITSLEMRLNHDYFVTTLYGTNYGRPPLLNWLIIPLAEMLGWDRMLLASRLVAATATVLTGLVLAWLTLDLTRNRALAAFAAVVFLSGDALFYRGWLAYADPLLTLCVFGAIACLWVAVLRKEGALLWLAVLLVTCGFLAKVQTAYLFYGVALVVLAAGRDARRFLLGAHSIAAHAAAVAALLAWNAYFTHGAQSASTGVDILLKIKSVDLGDYLHQLWSFPPETVLRLAPASLVFVYYWWRTRAAAPAAAVEGFPWRTLLAMASADNGGADNRAPSSVRNTDAQVWSERSSQPIPAEWRSHVPIGRHLEFPERFPVCHRESRRWRGFPGCCCSSLLNQYIRALTGIMSRLPLAEALVALRERNFDRRVNSKGNRCVN